MKMSLYALLSDLLVEVTALKAATRLRYRGLLGRLFLVTRKAVYSLSLSQSQSPFTYADD